VNGVVIAFAVLLQAGGPVGEGARCDDRPADAVVASIRSPGGVVRSATTMEGQPRQGPADRWFASDKLRHFGISFAATGFAYASLRALGVERRAALAGAGTASLLAGLGKELYDQRLGRRFSLRDLAWDVAGAVAGMALADRSR